MRIIAIKTIKDFWDDLDYGDSEQPLKAWYHEVRKEEWKTPNDIKKKYKSTSILKNKRVVFNIAGNKYRLVVAVKYNLQIIYVRFIGTHEEYNKINVEKI